MTTLLEQRTGRLMELLEVQAPPALVSHAIVLVVQAGLAQMPVHLAPALSQWVTQAGICPFCQSSLAVQPSKKSENQYADD